MAPSNLSRFGMDEHISRTSPTGQEMGKTSIVFRVAKDIIAEQSLENDSRLLPVQALRLSQVVLMETAVSASIADSPSPADFFNDLSPQEPMLLVMEDYLLRHAPGWALIWDLTETDPKLPSDIAQQRQLLDERIQKYAERAKAFWTTIRKRD